MRGYWRFALFMLFTGVFFGLLLGQVELLNPGRAEIQRKLGEIEVEREKQILDSQKRLFRIEESLRPYLLWARELTIDFSILALSVSTSIAVLVFTYTVSIAIYTRLTGHPPTSSILRR